MTSYTVRRLLWVVVILWGVSLLTFLVAYAVPADPARLYAGLRASAAVVRSIRHQMGLDRPVYVQYLDYMGHVLRGDFGYSYHLQSNVLPVILGHFPATAGTAYSAEGPSGVIELTLGATGNLTTVAPTAGTFQNLGSITVKNRYCTSTSIVIVNIVSKSDDGAAPDCAQAIYTADVDNRAAGSFDLRVAMRPTATSATNYSTSDKIRVAYMITNAGK